jgi:hypothetical protein
MPVCSPKHRKRLAPRRTGRHSRPSALRDPHPRCGHIGEPLLRHDREDVLNPSFPLPQRGRGCRAAAGEGALIRRFATFSRSRGRRLCP